MGNQGVNSVLDLAGGLVRLESVVGVLDVLRVCHRPFLAGHGLRRRDSLVSRAIDGWRWKIWVTGVLFSLLLVTFWSTYLLSWIFE